VAETGQVLDDQHRHRVTVQVLIKALVENP
jgi:hypothetical protein